MIKLSLSFLFILLFVNIDHGQSKQEKQLEKKIDEVLSNTFKANGPGCAVLITRKNTVIYKKAFGNASIELKVAMQPDMVFNLASITKQFTAVAILQLAEQNKLSLQDSIQKFIPDYPFKGSTITIEHLLTHTAGIKDYLQLELNSPNIERWDFTPQQLIDSFKTVPLQFSPGTKFSYSNSGYYLLGYIIEKITGKTYQDYIEENLFKPLGMTHSFFDRNNQLIAGRVTGYRTEGTAVRNVDFWSPTIMYAAGGILSNTEDLFAWHRSLYTYKVIKKESLEKALTPCRLKDGTLTGYGYGWYTKTINGIRTIEHQGGLPGFQTKAIYYPDDDVFMVILSNNGNAPLDELTNSISAIVLNRSLQPDIRINNSITQQYLGTYRLSADTSRTITVLLMDGRLVAQLPNKENVPILFSSETKFQFKNVLNADCEFIISNGKTIKIAVNQNGYYEWIKVE